MGTQTHTKISRPTGIFNGKFRSKYEMMIWHLRRAAATLRTNWCLGGSVLLHNMNMNNILPLVQVVNIVPVTPCY